MDFGFSKEWLTKTMWSAIATGILAILRVLLNKLQPDEPENKMYRWLAVSHADKVSMATLAHMDIERITVLYAKRRFNLRKRKIQWRIYPIRQYKIRDNNERMSNYQGVLVDDYYASVITHLDEGKNFVMNYDDIQKSDFLKNLYAKFGINYSLFGMIIQKDFNSVYYATFATSCNEGFLEQSTYEDIRSCIEQFRRAVSIYN